MLDHMEGFEKEQEYSLIWDKLRYKKVEELYAYTNEVIDILNKHIDETVYFHSDYHKIQDIFHSMRTRNFFYFSKSAKNIISIVNPKFKNIYKRRKCKRKLKYLGSDLDYELKKGAIYTSTHFNGATYTFNINGKEKVVGSLYFERLS